MEMDLKSEVAVGSAFDNAAITTDTTTVGNIVDSIGFESLTYAIQAGTLTDGAYTVTITEGDVLSGGTPDATNPNVIRGGTITDGATVSSDFIIGSLPSFADSEDDITKAFGFVGKDRYSLISIVSSGTESGGFFSAQAILGHAKNQPTS